jgi:Cysteine dioxygenase type I
MGRLAASRSMRRSHGPRYTRLRVASVADTNEISWSALLQACETPRAKKILRKTPFPLDDLLRLVPPAGTGEPYGRHPVYRGPEGEVLLVRWEEGQFCAPHDHGGARAIICLLRGEFWERHYSFDGRSLVAEADRELESPAVMSVRANTIHDMQATGGGFGVHFYLPAVSTMRVFDTDKRRTITVGETCGAWLPRNPNLTLRQEPWLP